MSFPEEVSEDVSGPTAFKRRRRSLFKPEADEPNVSVTAGQYPSNYPEKIQLEAQKWKSFFEMVKKEYVKLSASKKQDNLDVNLLDEEQRDFIQSAPDYNKYITNVDKFCINVALVAELQDNLEELSKQRKFVIEAQMQYIEKKFKEHFSSIK